ncbi:MAG TPA: tRNA (adenosine(37)-N6)-threonylcarbamoyltransferase complex dimerization subunit type 1 TsaB [Dehalococcoidia bacterium]|nr:tRNA (adenosine(37)-N6)-threonylcarbamoyltransferase complex dimerization subunit type 1 TsaB [Dehalococcoidia bacterium]
MELSIDTASETASIALSREAAVLAEKSWRCERNHTVEVLPAIDRLITDAGGIKADLSAVFVSTGPGMYTGLRVGIAIAKGISIAMKLPLVGVGRLELDAYPHRAFAGEVIAVHNARRGEFAWAAYRGGPWREVREPKIAKPDALVAAITERTLVVGEVTDALAETLRAVAGDRVVVQPTPELGRAPALAALGWQRLQSGGPHEAALVVPVYLRPPAIGPQSGS